MPRECRTFARRASLNSRREKLEAPGTARQLIESVGLRSWRRRELHPVGRDFRRWFEIARFWSTC
jgi:hypothetical protein